MYIVSVLKLLKHEHYQNPKDVSPKEGMFSG